LEKVRFVESKRFILWTLACPPAVRQAELGCERLILRRAGSPAALGDTQQRANGCGDAQQRAAAHHVGYVPPHAQHGALQFALE